LQRGLNALSPEDQQSRLAERMRLVEQKFMAALLRHGVTPIDSIGQKFDPTVHEAVEMEPSGGDTVVAVYAPGYRLGSNVLRPAMVKVGNGDGNRPPVNQSAQ
jgi:molecular chaperone GrpE